MTANSVAVLVPVKRFADAKARLAPALGAEARSELARSMAERVVGSCAPLPVSVVCDDPEVRSWAGALGHSVVWAPGVGLNGAVETGVAHLADQGAERVIVVHADLVRMTPGDLAVVGSGTGVSLVPDRHEDGTNVASVPTRSGFRWSYGPGSFARHCAEAARCGLELEVVRDARLGWDVDTPADLVAAT